MIPGGNVHAVGGEVGIARSFVHEEFPELAGAIDVAGEAACWHGIVSELGTRGAVRDTYTCLQWRWAHARMTFFQLRCCKIGICLSWHF
jgi:hypothetical protein